jgi:hypothetical protein
MKKLTGVLRLKKVKRIAVVIACVVTVTMLALTVSASSPPAPTIDFDEAILNTIGPAIVGVINSLLPIGIAILIPIIGLRLIPRIIYMFL